MQATLLDGPTATSRPGIKRNWSSSEQVKDWGTGQKDRKNDQEGEASTQENIMLKGKTIHPPPRTNKIKGDLLIPEKGGTAERSKSCRWENGMKQDEEILIGCQAQMICVWGH